MTETVFKDAKELEEFFHNLGIEYRFSCYKERNAEGCHLLGEFLDVIRQDPQQSAKVLKENCDRTRYAKSCDRYGTYCFNGKGMKEPDYGQALDYFRRACDADFPTSCYHAGRMLTGSDPKILVHVKPEIKEAIRLLEKGCQLGLGESCFSASTQHLFGKFGNTKNLFKAFEFSKMGCDVDHYESCINLMQMYKRGEGTQRDLPMAMEIRKKIEDLDEQRKAKKGIQMQQTE